MSMRRVKTPGWAAFDPKKQQKQANDNEAQDDPYPPISSSIIALQNHKSPSRNGDLTTKSFFSVLTHGSSVPNTVASEDSRTPLIENGQSVMLTEKLKVDHPWASQNLIEDIVAAVDNDVDHALTLLSEMAPRLQEKKEIEVVDSMEAVGLIAKNDEQLDDEHNVALGFMIDMSMIPMEPECEDDDLYLMHRKEAIRSMRLASRLSKAASEAYLRRDHAAAQEHSLRAREEWSNAQKLNAKAAKEILAIRNSENDDWKLDLHGLHATEAVQVLQDHLLKIESRLSGTHSTKPNKTDLKVDKQPQLSKPRLLEVITGKGSHSRGEAALPVAIRSFLSENGYYYSEARTGVIMVQPKFRQLSTALP